MYQRVKEDQAKMQGADASLAWHESWHQNGTHLPFFCKPSVAVAVLFWQVCSSKSLLHLILHVTHVRGLSGWEEPCKHKTNTSEMIMTLTLRSNSDFQLALCTSGTCQSLSSRNWLVQKPNIWYLYLYMHMFLQMSIGYLMIFACLVFPEPGRTTLPGTAQWPFPGIESSSGGQSKVEGASRCCAEIDTGTLSWLWCCRKLSWSTSMITKCTPSTRTFGIGYELRDRLSDMHHLAHWQHLATCARYNAHASRTSTSCK